MPGDDTDDFIRDLREGHVDLEDDDDDTDTGDQEATSRKENSPSEPPVPPVIRRVLDSSACQELVAIAKSLDPVNNQKNTVIFHTPIGDVKCPVNWVNNPGAILDTEGLIIIKVRTNDVTFRPTTGAVCELSFEGYPNRARVMCLESPPPIYPGVDLLCFLPHNESMEKVGVLKEGAPSVVSGKPSDDVDENGEPVTGIEKTAGVQDFDNAREVTKDESE